MNKPQTVFNWEGTIKKVSDEMTIGGVPPNKKNHGLLIRG